MENIVIIGGGGHTKVLISTIKKNNTYSIIGYTDNINQGDILGVKYLGGDNILSELFNAGTINAALGVGQVQLTRKRFEIIEKIKRIGFRFPQIISKNAIINESVLIGEGSQIFDGVIINSDSSIGDFTILNTNSTVEHDCQIGNYCHIATGAVLSGGIKLGDFCMVGSNAVLVQYREIVENSMIGAGAVVNRDIEVPGIYAGVPARKIR